MIKLNLDISDVIHANERTKYAACGMQFCFMMKKDNFKQKLFVWSQVPFKRFLDRQFVRKLIPCNHAIMIFQGQVGFGKKLAQCLRITEEGLIIVLNHVPDCQCSFQFVVLLTIYATCLNFDERLYSLHISHWALFFFINFAMCAHKLFFSPIQFD